MAEVFKRFPFTKVSSLATRWKRAGATLTLEFMARNPLRDQFAAAIYSKHGYIPFYDGFRGVMHVMKKDKMYWDWVKAGGRYSDHLSVDRINLEEALEDVIKDRDALQVAKDMANPLNVLKNLQAASEIMEGATRVMLFQRAREGGATEMEAANESKTGTLNFAQHGLKGKMVNMHVAFFNASILDLEKITTEHNFLKNPKRAMEVSAKAFMYITVPSILTWLLGKDDEEIEALPDWRKQCLSSLARMRTGSAMTLLFSPFLSRFCWARFTAPRSRPVSTMCIKMILGPLNGGHMVWFSNCRCKLT